MHQPRDGVMYITHAEVRRKHHDYAWMTDRLADCARMPEDYLYTVAVHDFAPYVAWSNGDVYSYRMTMTMPRLRALPKGHPYYHLTEKCECCGEYKLRVESLFNDTNCVGNVFHTDPLLFQDAHFDLHLRQFTGVNNDTVSDFYTQFNEEVMYSLRESELLTVAHATMSTEAWMKVHDGIMQFTAHPELHSEYKFTVLVDAERVERIPERTVHHPLRMCDFNGDASDLF